jgi:hypothetical protein
MGCGCGGGRRSSVRRTAIAPRLASNRRRPVTATSVSGVSAFSASTSNPILALKRQEIEKKRRDQILRKFGKI